MLSSEGCVTLANGQSGRSQLLGNTLGTLTLACRWEGDPSNTSLHRGVSAPTSGNAEDMGLLRCPWDGALV